MTLRAAARQAPLSLGILQARMLEWVTFPSPGNLPDPGFELLSPALQADSLLTATREHHYYGVLDDKKNMDNANTTMFTHYDVIENI